MLSRFAGRTYNVVDDEPASRAEVMAFAEELVGERCRSTSTSTNLEGSASDIITENQFR